MKDKYITNKKVRLIVILSVIIALLVVPTLAWFIQDVIEEAKQKQDFLASNFQASPDCYFMNGENKVSLSEIEGATDGKLIVLSTNPEDDNYIGKFRVDVKYKGDGAGYLRVKMVHEYSINGNSTQHPANVPYTVSGDWYDNRGNDYCYYYKNELDAGGDAEQTLNFITANNDIDLGELADGIVIKVAVETDMVQINRYPQIWDMDKLPWVE